jgi:PPOX class probable FMN-dependent enzyme
MCNDDAGAKTTSTALQGLGPIWLEAASRGKASDRRAASIEEYVVHKTITTIEELDRIYGAPVGAAVVKEIDYISDDYRVFIDKSPFVVIATVGPEGLDCSPRGDPPGFVRVKDTKTVLIPDRRGNNRIDALRNIVRDPRVSLLFMIPGVGNTLRINGRAEIFDDPTLTAEFTMEGKQPRTVLSVTADSVYFQCPKALVRSQLWNPAVQIPRSALPSTGEILARLSKGAIDASEYDRSYPARLKETIY